MQHTYADLTGMTFWDAGASTNPHVVTVGPYRLDRDDIQGCAMSTVTERDAAGRVWTMTLFIAGAALVLLGVVEFGWMTRFLLGAAVLAALAAMSAVEALKLKPITHWRLDIAMRGGRTVRYATANRTDAEILTSQINAIARRNATAE